jgi:hypothetical protein
MNLSSAQDLGVGMRAALENRSAAWHFVKAFAAAWRAPIEPGDGYTDAELDAAEADLGLRLPTALREAYALFGRRDDLTRNQDALLPPDELYVFDCALVYQKENQGVAWWGVLLTDLDAADPPTVSRLDLADKSQERWEPWAPKLSVALVEMVMAETLYYQDDELSEGTEWDGSAPGSVKKLPTLLPEVAGSTWYFGHEALLHVSGEGWVSVRARTPAKLEAALDALYGENDEEE